MTHSMEPSGFLSDRGSSGAVWQWRMLDADGAEVAAGTTSGTASGPAPRFTSQGDAETWIGEVWRELLDDGVDSVVLLEGDREVYGPMSLRA